VPLATAISFSRVELPALEMPPKVAAYVAEMSRLSGVPLQTGRAV